jgi:hypothetical protein
MNESTSISRKPILLFGFILFFVTLACTCNTSNVIYNTPMPIYQAPPVSPYTLEELSNAGTHTYMQVTEEFNCTASDPSSREMLFTVTFNQDAVEVIPLETPSGGHIYDRVDNNTYAADLGEGYYTTITFYQEGFSLYSEVTTDGGQSYSPCILYTRTRLD